MKKKKILYVVSNNDGTVGGSYYSLLYLLKGLNKDRYEKVVLFNERNVLIPEYERAADSVIVLNYFPAVSDPIKNWTDALKVIPRFGKYVLWNQKTVCRLLKQIRPDCIHLNHGFSIDHAWILAAKLRNIRIIAHDRGTMPPYSIQTRIFVRMLDAIISVSDAYLSNISSQGLKPKRAIRVYNGLDAELFRKNISHSARESIRNELGIEKDNVVVGMVGNIVEWKGQHIFIRALKRIAGKKYNIKGLIVGKTQKGMEKYEKGLKEYVKSQGLSNSIIFTGYRSDIPNVLEAIDIFVHASIEPEPFGRGILEAMAFKKPIVATNHGGTAEQIVNGESGLLVPPNDPYAMAEKIEELLLEQNKGKALGESALLRLDEKFTIKNMVDGTEDVYQEVLST